MKRKLRMILLAMVLGLVFVGPQCAISAELLWANVIVNRAIQTNTIVQAVLTEANGVFSNKLFNIRNDKQDAMLAVLLTAISLNKQVRIAFYDGSPATLTLVGTIAQ